MTLRRLMLGRSLEQWRERAGLSRDEVAVELGCTTGRVRHLESGRNVATRPDLIVMAAMYGIPDDAREALLNTRSEAQKPGWWQTYRLPKRLAEYVTLESDATRVRNWEGELIPGLLQTDLYARRVATVGDPTASEADVSKRIAARLRRQERLTAKDAPLQLVAVMSEAALQRCAAVPEIGRDQLVHLVLATELANVSLHVLPFGVGIHPAMGGGFALLEFPPDTWPETGYQEYNLGGHLVDDPAAVASLGSLFDELAKQALSEDDSIRLISRYID
ncbi:helix-turn-helix domain-containing protein [Saccharopolyspora rosea]|uniref:Helix-turn-helix domain-containing protein n=1 Tax=Saccharopolyspora rosea TaxID=524884 RepID=A0ABW3FQ96_9PSEU|nr:helix-turn-helix transcriptional regulator [Saccharopolyspora rosea]